MLRQFRESILNDPANAPVGEVQVSLTSLEAPSNYLALNPDSSLTATTFYWKRLSGREAPPLSRR